MIGGVLKKMVFLENDIWFTVMGILFFCNNSRTNSFLTFSVLVRFLNRERSWWSGSMWVVVSVWGIGYGVSLWLNHSGQ